MTAKKKQAGPILHRIWNILTIIVVIFLIVGSVEQIFRIWGEVEYTNVCRDLFKDIYKFDCHDKTLQSFITILIPPAGFLGMQLISKGLERIFSYVIHGKK